MGLYHLLLRKRTSENIEPFPALTIAKRRLDRLVFAVGIAGPITAIPQMLKIYILHNANGVSPVSWGLPALLDIPWIAYGVVHRERAIAVSYTLWFVINAVICFGAVIYGSGL